MDVPDLWYGKPSYSCMPAFEREECDVEGRDLYLLHLCGRIHHWFFSQEI